MRWFSKTSNNRSLTYPRHTPPSLQHTRSLPCGIVPHRSFSLLPPPDDAGRAQEGLLTRSLPVPVQYTYQYLLSLPTATENESVTQDDGILTSGATCSDCIPYSGVRLMDYVSHTCSTRIHTQSVSIQVRSVALEYEQYSGVYEYLQPLQQSRQYRVRYERVHTRKAYRNTL